MGISVKDYSSDSLTDKVYSKYTTNKIDTNVTKDENSAYMDFDGYLQMLTAQMSNQDFNNSMSDSEFIQQMSSYSMMEAISQLTKQNALSYSASLIGKAVTVFDGSSYDTGIVESVSVTEDGCNLLVNGSQYSTDSVTDVVDGQIYSMLSTFKGHEVELKDGDATVTGKVTSVLIQNGKGYVVINNDAAYDMDAIVKVLDSENDENKGDSTEGDDTDTEKTETAGTASVDENISAVRNHGETSGVVHASSERSAAVFDTLMQMLDRSQDENTASVASVEEMYAATSVMSNLERMNYMTASVEKVTAQSGLVSDIVPRPYGGGSYAAQTPSSPSPFQNSFIDEEISSVNMNTSPAASTYDRGDEYGITRVSGSEATTTFEEYASTNSASMSNAYTMSIPKSNRRFADEYPLEAAFADSVGTEMGDIRFISNTRVCDEINTDRIIGYTERKGHPVTDVGWCGIGKLGEVVTFADGTQRVEILYGDRVSHLHTSGNYTISDLLKTYGPGELIGKLTPQESAIRYHARQYSASEQATLDEFAASCAAHAFNNKIV